MDDTIKLLNEEEKEANERLKSATLKDYKAMNKEQTRQLEQTRSHTRHSLIHDHFLRELNNIKII